MGALPVYPSLRIPDPLDEFFSVGRNMWPDMDELKGLRFDRSRVPDPVVRFIRSTALNEYGVAHYISGYHHYYGEDYKLKMWAAIWAAEEYVHYVVLRRMLEALGEELTEEDFAGLESGDFLTNHVAYLDKMLVDERMDRRMQQLIFGVVQEYSAVIAYTAAGEKCGIPEMQELFKRIAKDEMRHCRFNQVALEAMCENAPEERELVWPQFRHIWTDFQMPQEQIAYFADQDMGTELYTSLWDGDMRSRMVLYLTHYFRKFREPEATAA